MNRQLAALDIYTMVSEMQDLKGCFIDKIYQLTKDDFLIKLRNPSTKKKEQMYIKNGEFICLTEKQIATPFSPSNFSMVLRKYISNARITNISQQEFDRIINIQFSKNKTYTLVIELFSNGNIILLNEENTIVLPLVQQEWAHRIIKPKQQYVPPPSQRNPFHITNEDFIKILKESKSDIVRTLAISVNLSGSYAEEICARANIKKNSSTADLTKLDISTLYEVISSLLERIKKNQTKPVCVTKQGEPYTVLPFEFLSYSNVTYKPIEKMTRGFDIFINETIQQKQGSKTQIQLDKLDRQFIQQEQAIRDLEQKIIEQKAHGDICYLHFQLIDQLLREIQSLFTAKDKTNLVRHLMEKPFIDSFDLAKKTILLKLEDSNGVPKNIEINIQKSIAENADFAYNESKKFKEKQEGAKKAILITKERIDSLQKHLQKEQNLQQETKIKNQKTFWFEKYRWFISSNGNLVIAGKDAKTNDQIVKKHLENNDRYVHADIHGAPSCIIKNKTFNDTPVEITTQSVTEACTFAVSYSKAWKQFSEAQAYWVLPAQVSKTPQSGEFVPKGAFIIRGQRNYCKCKLEIGIGLIQIDDTEKIIGGPVEAIEKWCNQYIILRPGGMNKKLLTKRLSQLLKTSADDINKVLPPGDSTIVSTYGFTQVVL